MEIIILIHYQNNLIIIPFIAYAYNGGAGYTRSQLKKGCLVKKTDLSLFLSMELISFTETRDYGKKFWQITISIIII